MSTPVIRGLSPGIYAPVPTFFLPGNEDLGEYHLLLIFPILALDTFLLQI